MPVYEEKEKTDGQTRYYIRTYVKDEFGRKKQVTRHNKNWIGRAGKDEARREELRLRENCFVEENNISLESLACSYLKELKPNVKLGTYIKHYDNITKYILPYFVNVKANSINNKNILDWKQKLENKGFSLNFKKSIYISFNAIFVHGCKYYNLTDNPVKNVGNFQMKKGHKKKEINIMTEEQFKNFILNISDDIYKIAFITLFYTGMRRGELLALEWDDIDFIENTININKTLNPKLKDENDNTPKTDKSNRIIHLIPIVIENLKKINSDNKRNPFEKLTLTTLKRKCDNACKKIKIEKFRIHDFRHSFASMCIDKGVPIEVISDYLGHENITTTLDTYGHLYPHSQDKLLSKFQ